MGTGPSRSQFPLPDKDRALVATCNAGWTLPRIDAYGVFEVKAAAEYYKRMRSIGNGGAAVFTRPRIQRKHDTMRLFSIGHDFGPAELRDLHEDVQWAEEDGTPEWGQHIAWISSGVLMMWIVAELYKPRNLYIVGLDGYKPGDPNPVSGYERTPEWTGHMNDRMAHGIERITQHYTDTNFILLNDPIHRLPSWRVTDATQDDLDSLFAEQSTLASTPTHEE